jgi:hypothetical protein
MVAGCGGGGSTTVVSEGASGASGASGVQGTAAGDRLGCHTYCQQAGGYGGGSPPSVPEMTELVTSGPVTPADNAIPVEIKCNFDRQCRGALLIGVRGGEFADLSRSDLVVDAGDTRTIAVPLSPGIEKALSNDGEVRAGVTVDSYESLRSLPIDEQSQWNGLGGGSITITTAGTTP